MPLLKKSDKTVLRKQLRGPSRLGIALADSIGLLNETAWNQVAAEAGFFLSSAYLAALERALPDNLSPRYALISTGAGEDAAPIAAVYMQIAGIELAQMRPLKPATRAAAGKTGWLQPLKEKIATVTAQRVLVCGNLLTFGQHGVAFAPEVDARLVWHGVAEVLYRVRQAEKLTGSTQFVMIKDLDASCRDAARHLEHLSYRYVETEPNMVLALNPAWRSHEDYLAGMSSKYRANVRNGILKPCEAAGCVINLRNDIAAIEDRVFELYKAVQENASFRPFELSARYFSTLIHAAGSRCRFTTLEQRDQILGFLVTVADGDTAVAYHIGFDREAGQDLPIYLRLLHAGIADAIALGCKRVSLGRTALEPKAALGAKPQDFGVLVRHRQPVLNKLLKHVLLGIEHEQAPERNPFKKEAAAA